VEEASLDLGDKTIIGEYKKKRGIIQGALDVEANSFIRGNDVYNRLKK